MFAKRSFYVCAGLFLLALSYHLGARSATAQSPSDRRRIVAMTSYFVAKDDKAMIWAATESGDAYATSFRGTVKAEAWKRAGNLFGVPTPPPSQQ